MSRTIRKAAVLGSGVMGSAIAAHLAGCGIPVVMLDIVPFPNMLSEAEQKKVATDKKIRNKLASSSLEAAAEGQAARLLHKKAADIIEIGNFDDDFDKSKTPTGSSKSSSNAWTSRSRSWPRSTSSAARIRS